MPENTMAGLRRPPSHYQKTTGNARPPNNAFNPTPSSPSAPSTNKSAGLLGAHKTKSMKEAIEKESRTKTRKTSKNVDEIVEDLLRDTEPSSMFDLSHCDAKNLKDCSRIGQAKGNRKPKKTKWEEATNSNFFRPFLKKDDMLAHHIEYQVEQPLRVSIRLEYLMGHTTAYLNDTNYVFRLHEAIAKEEERIHDQVTALREEKEKARVRTLVLEGLMEPPTGMEDLSNHPIFKVNKMLVAMGKLEKEYKETREPIDGKLTPVEPFEFDSTGNYFTQLHHDESNLANYMASDGGSLSMRSSQIRSSGVKLSDDKFRGVKGSRSKAGGNRKSRSVNNGTDSRQKSESVLPVHRRGKSAFQLLKESITTNPSTRSSLAALLVLDEQAEAGIDQEDTATSSSALRGTQSLTWEQKQGREQAERIRKRKEEQLKKEKDKETRFSEQLERVKSLDDKFNFEEESVKNLKEKDEWERITNRIAEGRLVEGENDDYAGDEGPEQLLTTQERNSLKNSYGGYESNILKTLIDDAPDAATMFANGKQIANMHLRENAVADDFAKRLNKLLGNKGGGAGAAD